MKFVALAGYINFLISFTVGLIVARHVTPSEFGLLVSAFAMAQVIRVPFSIGVYNKLAGSKELTDSLLGAGFSISVLQCIGAFFLSLIAYPWYSGVFGAQFSKFVLVFAIMNVVSSLKEVLSAKIFFDKAHRQYFWAEVSGALISAVLVIMALSMSNHHVAIILQFYAQAAVSIVIGMFLLRPWCSLGSKADYRVLMKSVKSYISMSITNNCLRDVDKLVLGYTANAASVGVYSRATRFSKMFGVIIPVGVVRSILPAFKKIINAGDDLTEVYMNYMRNFLYALIPFALMVGFQSENVLRFLYGEQWIAAAPILSLLMVNVVLIPLRGLTEQISYAHEKPEPLAKLSFTALIVYAVAMYVLIYRFGVIGAAASLVIHSGITFSGALYFASKYIRISGGLTYFLKVSGGCLFTYAIFTMCGGLSVEGPLIIDLFFRSSVVLLSYCATMILLDANLRGLVFSGVQKGKAIFHEKIISKMS